MSGDDIFRHNSTFFVRTTFLRRLLLKNITICTRVTAQRDEFSTEKPDKECKTRAKWYGIVSESEKENRREITCDNVMSTTEKSS